MLVPQLLSKGCILNTLGGFVMNENVFLTVNYQCIGGYSNAVYPCLCVHHSGQWFPPNEINTASAIITKFSVLMLHYSLKSGIIYRGGGSSHGVTICYE